MPKKDIGLGVVSIGFGIWVLTVANELKKKAAFWPKIVAWGIIILGAIILLTGIYHLVQERKASGKQSSQVKAETKAELIKYAKVGGIILLLVAFYFLFQYVSYILATVIMIIGTCLILGYRNWKVLIPTALITSVVLYVAFAEIFHVHFPAPFY